MRRLSSRCSWSMRYERGATNVLLLQTKRLDEGCPRGWLLPPARIVEKIASERRTPVFQHTHERTARELWRDVLFKGSAEADEPMIRRRRTPRLPALASGASAHDTLLVKSCSR